MIKFINKSNSSSLVLFIHGFTGSQDTWENSSGVYFPEMLLRDKDIKKNFDFAYFSYYTQLFNYAKVKMTSRILNMLFLNKRKKSEKNLDIKSIAKYVESYIRYNCKEYSNIILIAHSMGGLISKSYILNELLEFNRTKVKMFISLAVPHDGSNIANLGKLLIKNNIQISDLEPLSNIIKELNSQWINQALLPKSVYFIGEYDTIVPKTSAISYGTGKAEVVYCLEDHLSISKPETEEDLVFNAVKELLLQNLNSVQVDDKTKIKKFDDDGRYDDELFVLKLLISDVHDVVIDNAKQTFYNAEFMSRALSPQELEKLDEIYIKIKLLYSEYFSQFLSSEIEDSNELVSKIHKAIREEDKKFLLCLLPKINELHKMGMLHQLANTVKEKIWWAKSNSKDVDEYLERKDVHE